MTISQHPNTYIQPLLYPYYSYTANFIDRKAVIVNRRYIKLYIFKNNNIHRYTNDHSFSSDVPMADDRLAYNIVMIENYGGGDGVIAIKYWFVDVWYR